MQKTLGNARQSTILWLLDSLDPRQPPTVRAKAVKALGAVVEADPTVLELADVQKAVERALQVRGVYSVGKVEWSEEDQEAWPVFAAWLLLVAFIVFIL